MANLPDVNITVEDGNLGRLPANQDGISSVILGPTAVAPGGASLMQPYLIRSLKEAESMGITQAYDIANEVMVWHQLKEFYDERRGPQPLWFIISNQVPTAYFDENGEADKLMVSSGGNIRLVTACYTPPGGAVGTRTEGLPNAVITMITEAEAFRLRQFALHRPVRVIIEGYGIESAADLTYDLRASDGPNADGVMVVIGQTPGLLPSAMSDNGVFASAARIMGRLSRIPVHRSPGRVKDGPMVGMLTANLSDGTSIASLSDADANRLNELGYVFFRTFAGLSGVYVNDDHAATPIESDFARFSRGRVIDKAARIIYRVYVNELNEDVELDEATGYMAISVVKNLEGICASAIETEMAGEITSVDVHIPPEQNILSTDELEVEVDLTPRGVAGKFRVKLAYRNPLNTQA